MSRCYANKKMTVDESVCIKLSTLRRWGYLSGYHSGILAWRAGHQEHSLQCLAVINSTGASYLQLSGFVGEKVYFKDYLLLVSTICRFGGIRWWLICPGCQRRASSIIRPVNATQFKCRNCHHLTYLSRQDGRKGAYGILLQMISLQKRINQAEAEIKRKFYRGVPTSKYRIYLNQCSRWSKATAEGYLQHNDSSQA